jgi:putative ABC transport system permease protein
MRSGRWMHATKMRVRALFYRAAVDCELEDELAYHVAMKTEENVARGMSRNEARRAALIDSGGIELAKENCRETRGVNWIHDVGRDVRYGLRQLRRSPGLAAAIIVTLMLGIAATTSIFTIVYATLLHALPYPEADRVVRIHDVRLQGSSTGGLVSVPRFFDLTARSKSFASVGFFCFEDATLITGARLPVAVRGACANAGFWKVFDVNPLLGRTFNEKDDQPDVPMVAVLSYGAWQRIFNGDPDVIGRQVTIEQQSTAIIGVMPKDFDVPAGIDLWRPAQFASGSWTWRGEGSRFINVVARLAPSVSPASAESDIRRIGEELRHEYADTDGTWQFEVIGIRDALYGELGRRF